jgi:carboxyl-terminal processing protease
MAGNDVKNLQLILTGLNLSPGRDDGYFDEKTEQSVKQFQTAHKLPATGKVDAATRSQLEESLRETMRKPENDLQLQKAVEVVSKQPK